MRVLVTGASGLIGSQVCDALLARGDEVAGLSRNPQRARESNPTVAWHAWDPTAERPPAAAFADVEGVINLVGEEINQRLTEEAKRRIRESRVRATKNLVDGMLAAPSPARVLVSQSATGYYGDCGEAIVDESAPPDDHFLSRVVVDWEAAAEAAEAGGVRVARLRTGLVLDPGGGLLKQLLLPFKLGVGGPLAGGAQYMPWIHRDDEIAMLALGPRRRTAHAAPTTQPRRTRSATASSRRRSAGRFAAPRSCRPRSSRSRRCAALSSPSRSLRACGWCRGAPSIRASSSASPRSTARSATCSAARPRAALSESRASRPGRRARRAAGSRRPPRASSRRAR